MSQLLLEGGRVGSPAAEGLSVWIVDDRIREVGPSGELRARAGAATSIDLRGCRILPGLVDTHTHFFELARRRAGVDLHGAPDLEEVDARLRAHATSLRPEQTWVGGGGWDPDRYGRPQEVDRHRLDRIFPHTAVALESRDFHTLWCNTRALEAAGVMAGRDAPPGGRVGRDGSGVPDGFLYETAWDLIWAVRPVEDDVVASAWIQDTVAYAHSLGLTGIHCMEPTSTYHHYRRLASRDQLRLRVCFHTPRADLTARIEEGARSYVAEDRWLRRGGVKIFGDGSLGSRSAWMVDPYPDGSHGAPLLSEEELDHDLQRAAVGGIAPSVHAIGDRTLAMVLRSFARLREAPGGANLLLRVEHAQCVPPAAVDELAGLGVFCAVQPVHLRDDVALLPAEWGAAAAHAYPLRSLLTAGVRLGLGSDAPVASLDPRPGLVAAVRRADDRGATWTPEQALTLEEALSGYTDRAAAGGAWATETGELVAGALADIVAVDDVGPDVDAWPEAATRLTIAGGEIVYDALG